MKFSLNSLALATLAVASAAQGQVPTAHQAASQVIPAEPSPAALTLAKALALPRLSLWIGRISPAQMKDHIKAELLNGYFMPLGRGCDPNNAACRAAADAIASRHAEEDSRMVNEGIDRGHALLFDAKMSPAQIRAALAFAKTDAGQAFAATLRANPGTDPDLAKRVLGVLKMPSAPFAEFHEATKDLPRATIPVAPPPPGPPLSPRRSN